MSMSYVWMSDKLKGEYKEVFDKAEIFVGVRNIAGDEGNEMMMDLLDFLLSAQKEGKPVEEVIGTDVEKFCASYFSSYTMKNHLMNVPKALYRLMLIVFVIEIGTLFFMWLDDTPNLSAAATDVSGYMLGFATGWLVVVLMNAFIRPFMFQWKWLTSGVFYTIVIVLTGAMIFGEIYLLGDLVVEVPVLSAIAISGSYILIYLVVRSVRRYRQYGSIRKPKEPFEKSGIKNLVEEIKEELPQELVNRFHKKNKKLERKGKKLMTPEEYMELLKKENKNQRRGDKIGSVIVIAVVAGIILQTALTSEWWDTIIFIVILAIVEIPAIMLFKLSSKTSRWRENIVEECEQRGITIIEYVEGEQTDEEVHDCTGSGNN